MSCKLPPQPLLLPLHSWETRQIPLMEDNGRQKCEFAMRKNDRRNSGGTLRQKGKEENKKKKKWEEREERKERKEREERKKEKEGKKSKKKKEGKEIRKKKKKKKK